MSLQKNNHELHLDDRLAEFTDEILVADAVGVLEPDDELSQLKQTILRLKTAYPPVNVDGAQIKQMYVRFKNLAKHEDMKSELPIWRQWLGSLQTRPLVRLTAAMAGILLIFLLLAPAFSSAGSSITAFAFDPAQDALNICAVITVIVLFVWMLRRK